VPEKIRQPRPEANPRSWVPKTSMLTTRPPKPLIQQVLEVLALEVRQGWNEADHSPSLSVKITKAWQSSHAPVHLHDVVLK
jgi:hypothetical protein